MRLVRICRNRPGSPRSRVGIPVGTELTSSIPFLKALSGHDVQGAFDRFDQIEIDDFKGHFACFDFGEIQNIVDDRQKRSAR